LGLLIVLEKAAASVFRLSTVEIVLVRFSLGLAIDGGDGAFGGGGDGKIGTP
jgi:hypothetical protein